MRRAKKDLKATEGDAVRPEVMEGDEAITDRRSPAPEERTGLMLIEPVVAIDFLRLLRTHLSSTARASVSSRREDEEGTY